MNNTRFKDGRLGIGKTPIFPLDVSGNTRIEGNLVLKGTIADASGVPIYFGRPGITSTDGSNNNYHIGINKATATDANFPLDVEGNVNINNGSLFINGGVAEFSNWTDIGETEDSGIYRNSKVAIGKTTANHILDVSGTVNIENGNILLNGATLDPNPTVPALQAYTDTGPTWKDATIITTVASSSDTTQALTTALNDKADKASPTFTGMVTIPDLKLTGQLYESDGVTPRIFSNWTVHSNGNDLYRSSGNVGIGTTSPGYKLEVNGSAKLGSTTVSYLKSYLSSGTGIWFDYADTMRFITNNTEKMIIKSDGNVGIGTTSPGAKLEIYDNTVGSSSSLILMRDISTYGSSDDGPVIEFKTKWTDNGSVMGAAKIRSVDETTNGYNGGLAFDTNFGYSASAPDGKNDYRERMRISYNGNVGIGTTSPGAKLEVKGDALITKNGPTSTTDANTTEMLRFKSPFTAGIKEEGGFKFITDDTYAGTTIYPRLTLYAYQGTGTLWEPQAITFKTTSSSNVNVGIGTTSPDNLLHIQKSDTGYGSNLDALLILERNDTNNNWINFVTKDGEEAGLLFGTSTSTAHGAVTYRNTDGMSFRTGGNNKRMVIDETGNVGIGTTEPQADLHIHSETTNYKSGGKLLLSRFYGSSTDMRAGAIWMSHLDTTGWAADRMCFAVNAEDANDAGNPLDKTPQMVLQANGNVGIGTTSPEGKLHIHGGGLHIFSNVIQGGSDAEMASNAADANIFMDVNNHSSSSSKNGIIWKTKYQNNASYTKTSAGIYFQPEGNYFRGGLAFYTNGTSNETTNASERLRIDMDGNVGIGTDNPEYLLHVDGTLAIGTNSAYGEPLLKRNTGSTDYFSLGFSNGTSSGSTNVEQALNVTRKGNVGIGTTSPEYHLDIRGSGYQIINVYSDGTGEAYARFSYNNNTDAGLLYCGAASNNVYLNSRYNYPMIFYINNAEQFRIETDGRFKRPSGSVTYCYADAGNLQWHAGSSSGARVEMHLKGTWNGSNNNSDNIFRILAKAHSRTLIQGNYDGVGIYGQYNLSDDRLKHNEVTVSNGLNIINKLTPKKYFKTDKMYEADHHFELNEDGKPIDNSNNIIDYKIETGLIAQELLEIDELKHLVRIPQSNDISDNDISNNTDIYDGYGIYYNDLFVYNIAATQELYKENQELKTKVTNLEAKLQSIEQRLAFAGF